MATKIYLLSFKNEDNRTHYCIQQSLEMLYDIKVVHEHLFMIKNDDDIETLEKLISRCFTGTGTYMLVDITSKENRFYRPEDSHITGWMDNI